MGCKIVQFGKYAKFLTINLCYKCEEITIPGDKNLMYIFCSKLIDMRLYIVMDVLRQGVTNCEPESVHKIPFCV